MRRVGDIAAAVGAVVLVAGCSSGGGSSDAAAPSSSTAAAPSSSSGTTTGDPGGALPKPEHVVVAVFENKDAGSVTGGRAPFLASLADQGAAFTNAHGETHPSQPNYLALFSGDTHGVTSDACPLSFPGGN